MATGKDGRIFGDLLRRWRAGELDDKRFERAYRLRAQALMQPIFLATIMIVVAVDWAKRDPSFSAHLQRLPMWLIVYGFLVFAGGLKGDRRAKFAARNHLLRRRRANAEAAAEAKRTAAARRTK